MFGDESDDDAKGAASKLEYRPKAKPQKRGSDATNKEESECGSENDDVQMKHGVGPKNTRHREETVKSKSIKTAKKPKTSNNGDTRK